MKKSHVPVKERETSSFNFNVFSNYQVLYLSHYGPVEYNGLIIKASNTYGFVLSFY